MRATIAPQSDFEKRYNAFVDQSPQGNLYCHSWWLEAVAPGSYEILAVEDGGQLKAVWPMTWNAREGSKRRCMPELTPKLGVLLPPFEGKYAEGLSRDHELLEKLIAELPPGISWYQHFHESFNNWLPFYWHGYQQTTRYTYVLEDLTNLDAIWENMRRNSRTEIRKAEKRGIHTRETADLEEFYAFIKEIFQRQDMKTPYSLEYLKRVDKACKENAGRRILIAEGPEGQLCAARYLIYDQRCAFLVCGGVSEVMRGSGANSLVDWEMIRFASTVSKRFDFTGSVHPSIEPYLRTFGAKRMPYFAIHGVTGSNSPAYVLRRLAARALRKLSRGIDGSPR